MRRMLFVLVVLLSMDAFADTPAEMFMGGYDDVKGAKHIEVKGGTMVFARPVIRKFPIGPMADLVEEVSVLNMSKTGSSEKDTFLAKLKVMLEMNYKYYGKSDTPNGIVDVYVHLASDDLADELVIYNPELFVLNSLVGKFPVEQLLKLGAENGR